MPSSHTARTVRMADDSERRLASYQRSGWILLYDDCNTMLRTKVRACCAKSQLFGSKCVLLLLLLVVAVVAVVVVCVSISSTGPRGRAV